MANFFYSSILMYCNSVVCGSYLLICGESITSTLVTPRFLVYREIKLRTTFTKLCAPNLLTNVGLVRLLVARLTASYVFIVCTTVYHMTLQALLELLQSERFKNCNSIIIYCTRREQTDRLATVIRTVLSNGGETTSDKIAESYHAGLSAAQRRRIQKQFMSGR